MDRGLVRTLVGAGILLAVSGAFGIGAQDPKGPADETSELLLFLKPGLDPAAYAREHGLIHKQTLRSNPDAHVFAAADAPRARAHRGAAGNDPQVRRAYLNQKLQRVKCAWVPNDPYYPNGSPAGFPGQWHLGNGAVAGLNVNVPAAWANDITGLGVTVGVVDDCLEIGHPDLAPNYVAADSWDFGQNDANPSPVNLSGPNEDRHGTSVAGVAAARGGNAIGGTGAAPHAGLAGLRIDFPTQTTAMFVDATQYHSSASSLPLSIKIKNHSYGYSAPFIESQPERDAVAFSAASGTIHLFAAGNERGAAGQDSNKQDVQSSPDVIAVAALGSDKKFSSYSSFGANVFITASSSGVSGFGITTTDRSGNGGYNKTPGDADTFPDLAYTSTFGGTSSATPLASGILALVKQVQPALDVRFAKHLLAITSQQVDPNDNTLTGGGNGSAAGSAWKTNAAGRKFNQNYGFGLIDAQALTQQAVLYSGPTTLQTESTGTVAVVSGAIPDNNAAGITRTFPIAATSPLEGILVTLNISHPYRGDLEAHLTSPAGTQCRLFSTAGDNGDDIAWTFAANAFWGENPAGTWTLLVRDVYAQDLGTWTSFGVTAHMGQLVLNATPPQVSSVSRAGANPTASSSVGFTVAFSENVTGVDVTDFAVTPTGGIAGASVSSVSGSGSLYTVTVNTGSGDGTIRLDVLDDNSILDASANPLNGAFSVGQAYTIDKSSPAVVRVTSTTSNGAYGAGAPINLTVDFTELVTLAGGNLQITLDTGDIVSIAPFGSSTSASVNYGVGAGDTSADLNSTLLSLSAGTLRDAAGNVCSLTIPGGQNLAVLKALVVDTTAPQIASVNSSTSNGAYGSGAAINVTVTFTEAVALIGGNLQVTLSTGDLVTILPFASSATASGTYTVGGGDNSLDLNATSPLTLSGGTLRDAAGNAAGLSIPGGQNLANLRDLVIDTSAPTVTVNQAAGQADPTKLGPILFTAVFSEAVSGFGAADVSFTGSTAGGVLAAIVSGAGPTYTISVSGMTSTGLVRVSIPAAGAADAAGNGNATSTFTDRDVLYDVTPPSVTIDQAGGQADPTNASPVAFSVVFSKPVTGFAGSDVLLGGTAGATTVVVSGGPTNYTVSVSGMSSDGSVTASIPAAGAVDAAGNGNLVSTSIDNSVLFDVTAPSVTINQAFGQSDPTNAGPIQFAVLFSEAVSGFAAADVSLAGSTVGGSLVVGVSGSGAAYTVSVTGMSGAGTVVASIAAGAALDGVGNPNTAAASTDATVTFNAAVPTVTVNQAVTQADPTAVASIVFTIVFSEAVSGFTNGDVSFAGSTAAGTLAAAVSGGPATYSVTVTGMTSTGTVIASIPAGVALNAATTGNAASTSADHTVVYDITLPTVAVNQALAQADPTNGTPILFTVVFSEPVTGFTNSDVVLTGATTAVVSGGPGTYTVSVTGATGVVTASLSAGAAVDAAGNASAASTSSDNSVAYDATAPTVTINQALTQADPTNGTPILFTVVFSEAVTGFTGADVTLGGVTTAIVTGGPATYSVSVTGMSTTGPVTASVAAGAAMDIAGNVSLASTSTDASVTYDNAAPTVTINQAVGQADPTNGTPILFTVVFSEGVTSFTGADVTLGGATTAMVTGGPATYSVSVTGMSTSGPVTASVVAGAAVDLAGNQSTASTSTDASVAYDNVAPTVTVNQAVGQADPTNGGSILFTVVFSEAVTGFTSGDVVLGGSAGATAAVITGGATIYTITVTGMSTSGSVTVSVPAGAANDAAGNASTALTSTDAAVTVDLSVPTVTINQAVGQADPTNSPSILFTVVFSEAVVGFSSADILLGGTAGATSVGVSGGPSTYTVTVSGMLVSGKVTAVVAAGAASDAAGNPNDASTSSDNAVTYDIAAPTITINQAVGQADPTNGTPILFTVVFSEAVTGFTGADVTLGGATTASVTGGPATYSVSVTGMSTSGPVTASVAAGAAVDLAGNQSTASTSTDASVTYDNSVPTVTINQALTQADPTNGTPILFTVVFSEAVTGFTGADVTLGGASSAVVTGGPATYNVSVTGMSTSGPITASVVAGAAVDLAGNVSLASTSTDASVTYDNTVPTVTINQAVGQADPTNGTPILFTVVFSEAVTGFTGADVTLGGATTAIVTGGPATYSVSVTGMSTSGPVTASVAAGAAVDLAGNVSLASTSTDASVTYDNTAPTVTINQAAGQADPTNGTPILFTVVFSEAVTGFTGADVTLGGATTAIVTGGPATYSVSVTGMSTSGPVTASVVVGAAVDLAGNQSTASTSTDASVTYDNAAPTVTINQAVGQADPTNGTPILFTVVFSEAVTGFTGADVTLGGATTAIVTGGPATYSVSVTGMSTSGPVTASVAAGAAMDLAGNVSLASTSTDASVTYDNTVPTVTINQAIGQADPAGADPILFTAIFSEPVSGFTAADVVTGGSATVSGGPATYTISVSGMPSDGPVSVTIVAGAAADLAGNPSAASTSTDNVVFLDTTAPVAGDVASPAADGIYGPGVVLHVTVTFSEPVWVTGVPRLKLETGAVDAQADYLGGSGTPVLTFSFAVAAGHASSDLDVSSPAALELNGGSIRDPVGHDALLILAAPGAPGSLGAARAIVVDGTPPVAGTVDDGWSGPDLDLQLSVTTLSAHWSGFSDPESGIVGYAWALGTSPGGEQIRPFSEVGGRTAASTSAVDVLLSLPTGTTCFVTIRATNGAGLTSTATSDGVQVTGTTLVGPSAPAAFYATAADQAALLDWTASTGAAFYRIWWKPAAAPWTDAILVDALIGTATTLGGLVNGTGFDFRLKAVDADGNESAGVIASATPQASITIGGRGGFATAADALAAAVAGETVVLGPGTFPGPLTLPPGVSILGSSPLLTTVTGTLTVQGTYLTNPVSTVRDLTITGGAIGVDGGAADVLLDHLVIHHGTSHGATSGAAGRLRSVNCTVMSNGGDGLRALGVASVRNCIVGSNAGTGLNLPVGSPAAFNDAYGNALDLAAGVSGTGNLAVAAVFVDEAGFDYREQGTSPTVDAGDTADGFALEPLPNGGRINMGAFGNTRWAASRLAVPTAGGGGGGGGGGCGATGLEFLLLAGAVRLLRRWKSR